MGRELRDARTTMPKVGDKRFFVEYLDHAQGIQAIKDGGGDVDNDTMWDYCSQEEIEVCREFKTKTEAVFWASLNYPLDVFHMPRIREETYMEFPADDRHFAVKVWNHTGYWEMDGVEEIEEYEL